MSRVILKLEPIRDYWRFTASACRELFGERFGRNRVTVESRGNVLASIAFLTGMAAEELRPAELERDDPD